LERIRIDKWLWAARFFKTRATATEAILGGRVRLNGERVKPAKDVRTADIVNVRIGEMRWTVVVRGLAEKRGPARIAATLYEETAESIAPTGACCRRTQAVAPPRRCQRAATDEAGPAADRGSAAGAAGERLTTPSTLGSTVCAYRVTATTSPPRSPAWA
jgi:ribosome-associated heat shock protein Hsp15